ncbi:nucleic acid-binding-like protein [Senna tora]|uniref:Nucleic acid-binding-like protein n=1 Tax=Senna tora TaxID=362788 RepID=A0A835CEK2_9FABA|nr:nucleic acid-binding-like protein [Senna tora]
MERDFTMDVDLHQEDEGKEKEEEEDYFLKFIDYARSELLEVEEDRDPDGDGAITDGPGWTWIVSRILKTCVAYSSGVTPAILLSELSQAWAEQRRVGAPKKRLEFIKQFKKNHRRAKLPNTVTIDSIYEKNFLSLSSVLEAVIVDAFVLPGTDIHMLTLGDYWSSNIIDLYLHRRFYNLADLRNGILKKGREVFLTGCYLRTASEGSGHPRVLPTEYLVILLDENQDDDAMLLGAQFCSDSFSSISLNGANEGVSYSLYARQVTLTFHVNIRAAMKKQITLVDGDGAKLQFLLWGEQTILSNLFRVGSMLALDKPYISSSVECDIVTSEELCLEYGTETQLYLVPYIQHEEQVCVSLTPNRHPSSRSLIITLFGPSRIKYLSSAYYGLLVNFFSWGEVLQSFVADLRDKMTSISLYGVVTDIIKEVTSENIFSIRIADTSGVIWAKLHFNTSWSLGRLSLGHTVFISGLSCSKSKQKRLEVLWFENDNGASFINLSCLPALINSSCLHKLSRLSDITSQTNYAQICRVWLDPMEHYHVNTIFSHSLCGHFANKMPSGLLECSFCRKICDAEVQRTFDLKITVADQSTKVLAWCNGQTAMDLLQISPEEFYELPEEEQVMYPSSLENERFMVALVNCKREGYGLMNGLSPDDAISWEITRAYKCE